MQKNIECYLLTQKYHLLPNNSISSVYCLCYIDIKKATSSFIYNYIDLKNTNTKIYKSFINIDIYKNHYDEKSSKIKSYVETRFNDCVDMTNHILEDTIFL